MFSGLARRGLAKCLFGVAQICDQERFVSLSLESRASSVCMLMSTNRNVAALPYW